MKKILSVLFTLVTFISFGQQYDPSISTALNKPAAPAQSIPTDARSYFFDKPNFKYRPYQNTAEVLSYLYLPKFRGGNFPVYINIGGTLSNGTFIGGTVDEYWFRNGTADSNLVIKTSGGGGSSNLDSARTASQIQILNSNGNGTIFLSADTLRAGAYPAADKKKVNRLVPFSNYAELRTTSNVTTDTTVIYQDSKGNQFQYIPSLSKPDDSAMIIVNGSKHLLRVTSGYLCPEFFNAYGDGSHDDWWPIQKMWNYFASTALVQSWSIKFGRNFSYYVTKSTEMPHALGLRSFIDIDGQGAEVFTDKPGVSIFRHMPVDQDEAGAMVSDWRAIIHNFNFEGTGLTGQKGIESGAMYQWTVLNNYCRNMDTSYDFRFSLGGTYLNLGSYGARKVGYNGGYGTWPGGGHGASAFNNNILQSIYINCYDASFAAIALTSPDQANVSNIIIEGLKPKYEYYFDYDGSTLVQANTIQGFHSETIPGTLTYNTVFKIKGSGVINIFDCHTERTAVLFNLDSSGVNTHINLRNFAYYQTVDTPFTAKNALLDGFEISGQNRDLVLLMHNASKWSGGAVPLFTISYQGASSDYETRSNVNWNIYAPDVTFHTNFTENLGIFEQYNTAYFNDDINLIAGRFHVLNGNLYQHEYLGSILSQQIYAIDSSFLETWTTNHITLNNKRDKFGHWLFNGTDAGQVADSSFQFNGSMHLNGYLKIDSVPTGLTSDSLLSILGGKIRKVAASAGGGGVSSFNTRTGAVVPVTNDYTWAQINKTTSSLADITTRSATDISSGTLNVARLPLLAGFTSGAGTVTSSDSYLSAIQKLDGNIAVNTTAIAGKSDTAHIHPYAPPTKNMIDISMVIPDSFYGSTGVINADPTHNWRRMPYIRVLPNTTYTLSGLGASLRGVTTTENKTFVAQITANTFTTGSTVAFVGINIDENGNPAYNNSAQLEIGSSATSYETYGYKIISVNVVNEIPAKLVKTTAVITLSCSNGYEYNILHDSLGYTAATPSYYNTWEMERTYEQNYYLRSREIVQVGQWEYAFQVGSDFVGGGTHGYEQKTGTIMLVDGAPVGEYSALTKMGWSLFTLIQSSSLYAYNSTSTVIATIMRRWEITGKGVAKLSTKITWASAQSLTQGFMGMIPTRRVATDGTTILMNYGTRDSDVPLSATDISGASWTGTIGVVSGSKYARRINTWGTNNDFEINVLRANVLPNSSMYISPSGVNKIYSDYCGIYTTSTGEIFETSIEYKPTRQ